MQKHNVNAKPRFTLADVIDGGRILLLPAMVIAALVAAGQLLQEKVAATGLSAAGLTAIPSEAWVWVFIAYVALILPRRPLNLSVPGLAPLAKAAIAVTGGAGFLLELRFHDRLEPLIGDMISASMFVGCATAAGLLLRAERAQLNDAGQSRDRLLHQLILEYEKLNRGVPDPALTHPALFAEVAAMVRPGSSLSTSAWFLRPHPALGYQRPIDVLCTPGGEARLLQACRIGPNS